MEKGFRDRSFNLKQKDMHFLKTFLAALLAFVVGSVLSTLLWIFVLIGIASSLSSEKGISVKDHSVLKLDFAEEIVDAPSASPLGAFDPATFEFKPRLTLFSALRAIEAAKNDPRIEGIYICESSSAGAALTIREELRAAIEDFKTSGKFVVAYNDLYGPGAYYLASVADKVYLQPEGGLSWQGLSFTLSFFKGLFDKLDIEYEIFRPTACKYKSAVEPYFLTHMSEANREQMQELVDSMWKVLLDAVSEARGIDPAKLDRLTDELALSEPSEALEHGMVDELLYEDQMEDVFASLGVEKDHEGLTRMVTLADYARQTGPDLKHLSSPQVAVVYAQGAIVDGEGSGKEVYGNTLAATLAEVRRDDQVKAVVLRVNSPGGSALASDVIWREVELLRAEKPVIVSMGAYAASGGYYISAPADAIVADRTTLTGSIGVFGAFPVVGEMMRDKLGITFDGVKSNTSADFGQSVFGLGVIRPVTPVERAFVMKGIDKVYGTFTSLVAEGRNLPLERVLEIAGGRVWSGSDALGIGLVDANGGLKTAIGLAAAKAELDDDYFVREVIETPTGVAAFLSALEAKVRENYRLDELGMMLRPYEKACEILRQQGILTYYPYEIDIR